jgi:hypothetical protein
MSIAQIFVGVFAGILLADHYKTDRIKAVLGSVVLGFFNVWIFLHLTMRKGWTTAGAIAAIVGGWFALGFFLGFLLAVANADSTLVRL